MKILKGVGYVVAGIIGLCAAPFLGAAFICGFPFYHFGRLLFDAEYVARDCGDMSQN